MKLDAKKDQSLLSPHKNASDEELLPVLCQSPTDRSGNTEDCRDEDRPTTTKIIVTRIADPAADERTSNVRARIDKSNK